MDIAVEGQGKSIKTKSLDLKFFFLNLVVMFDLFIFVKDLD